MKTPSQLSEERATLAPLLRWISPGKGMLTMKLKDKTITRSASEPIEIPAPETLHEHLQAITERLETQGYCHVQAWDTSLSVIKSIAQCLGAIQRHMRSDADGIVGEKLDLTRVDQRYRMEYQKVADGEFLPHTDGSFLAGLYPIDGVMRSVDPPHLLILQCVRPAQEGGANLLIDAQQVLTALIEDDIAMAGTLSRPGCVACCRGEQVATHLSVYSKLAGHRYGVRFRYDHTTYAPP